MERIVGWKSGNPDDSRMVRVLRVLNNGERVIWRCWYCHYSWQWVTYDGVYIDGVLGWRELKVAA